MRPKPAVRDVASLRQVLSVFAWLDEIRWAEATHYNLINYSEAGLSPDEQLLVRMDDKLSRIVRGKEEGEDVVLDLIGYAVLYAISIDKDFVYLTRSCAADLIEKINDVNMATRFIHQMCDDLLDVATKLYEYKKEQKYKIETFLAELGNDLITFNLEQALLFAAHFLLWSLQKENDNDH